MALEQQKELDALAELRPGGGLGGPREFADFVASPRFAELWRTRTGQDYVGPTEAARLTTAEVQAIVEVLLPSARHLDRTGEHVHRPQVVAPRLSGLLAELLSGRLAEPKLERRHDGDEAPAG